MANKKREISIRDKQTRRIVDTIDITGLPERRIAKIIKGIKLKIDHSKYYINGVR